MTIRKFQQFRFYHNLGSDNDGLDHADHFMKAIVNVGDADVDGVKDDGKHDEEDEADHAEDCDDKGPKSHCAKVEAKGAMKRRGQAFKISRVCVCWQIAMSFVLYLVCVPFEARLFFLSKVQYHPAKAPASTS